MRAGSCGLAIVLAIAAGTAVVGAHRLDECLQAARLAIEPDRITLELDVTPGVAIAESFITEIDLDRDGAIAAPEQEDFARRVLESVNLSLDGRRVRLTGATATFPAAAALRTGEGVIRLRAGADLPAPAAGLHRVSFRNRYRADVSVYLANALVPESDRIAITAQRHSVEQRELEIDYQLHAETIVLPWSWIVAAALLTLTVFTVRSPSRHSVRTVEAGSSHS